MINDDGTVNKNLQKGTAVGTFDSNGKYFPNSKEKNSGIFMGSKANETFRLVDQWPTVRDSRGNVRREAVPPHERTVGPNGANPSDNSYAYYVIIVKR